MRKVALTNECWKAELINRKPEVINPDKVATPQDITRGLPRTKA